MKSQRCQKDIVVRDNIKLVSLNKTNIKDYKTNELLN